MKYPPAVAHLLFVDRLIAAEAAFLTNLRVSKEGAGEGRGGGGGGEHDGRLGGALGYDACVVIVPP